MKELNQNKFLKIGFILLFILFVWLFLTFLYGDILITTNASITFDDLFFKGRLYELYKETYFTFGGFLENTCITYDFPIYIFFGLWNLPLWIITKLTNMDWTTSYGAILYAKLFLVALVGISLYVMNKILLHFQLKDAKMYNFLFLSSSLVLMVITMFAGYDILSMVFVLLGIYYYLKDDLKKFTLFFAVAISLKLFALIIFIPLLLLKEKNIWKIILYGIASVSLLFLSKLIYMNAPMYYESMHGFESNMLDKLTLSYIVNPFGNTSIFLTIYVFICFWCYGKKESSQKLIDLYTMYIPLVIYGFFSIFCQIHPQWIIIMMPYFIFFLIYNKEKRNTNILVECVFTVSMMLIFYQVYTWVFSPDLMRYTVGQFIPQTNGISTISLFQINRFSPMINSVILASFLYFIWMNKPEKLIEQKETQKWDYSLLFLRMLIIVPFAGIIVYYYFR